MPTTTLKTILQDVKRGKPVIVIDDAHRENEGDIMIAAEKITARQVNFLTQQARGLVCVAMTGERLDALQLPPMVRDNTEPFQTDFAISVNARQGVTTGISAADRATTIKALIHPKTTPYDLVRPGHIFPLRAKAGGVLQRAGHTEAAVDLARLAGLTAAGVTCEIMNPNGTMARLPQLRRFARRNKIHIVTIADLIAYRKQTETLVHRLVDATIPTPYGAWQLIAFGAPCEHQQHLALVKGKVTDKSNVVVRMHSECLTGDIFQSQRCDCGPQLEAAMNYINKVGNGVIVYLRQEGRGIGLVNKLKSYNLQDQGLDTVEANIKLGFAPDLRDYGIGAQILKALGLSTIKLLTNNPKKVVGLAGHGLKITKQIPLQIQSNKHNLKYLRTKQTKMGHTLDV